MSEQNQGPRDAKVSSTTSRSARKPPRSVTDHAAITPPPEASNSRTVQSTHTQSLVTNRSASTSRPAPGRMIFRPKLPPRRPIVKDEVEASKPLDETNRGSLLEGRPSRPVPRRSRNTQPEMVASGPFAQGSASLGERKSVSTVSIPPSLARVRSAGAKRDDSRAGKASGYDGGNSSQRSQDEVYSDMEEDGVQIIDMGKVETLDLMAPHSIPSSARRGGNPRIKEDVVDALGSGESVGLNLTNLGEADEILDDLSKDFCGPDDLNKDDEKLFLFQFPPLLPLFTLQDAEKEDVKDPESTGVKPRRSVAFADDTRGGAGPPNSPTNTNSTRVKNESEKQDRSHAKTSGSMTFEGQIGRLDVYSDGRVQMLMGDNIVMEVTGASQTTFLQQVMILDSHSKQAVTLGNLRKKFVVAPEISMILADSCDRDSDDDGVHTS